MTASDRILTYLGTHPDGVDDDALAAELGLTRRQHANQECRRLEQRGQVVRRRVGGKIRNFLVQAERQEAGEPEQPQAEPASNIRSPEEVKGHTMPPWHWEGNVQAALVCHLTGDGYRIIKVSDTASKERGPDIVAITPAGEELQVSVKGYPEGTERTHPATQARHYFVDAFYDLFAWREENPKVILALGLPDFSTYRKMSRRVASGVRFVGASLFWVFQDGHVEVEETFWETGKNGTWNV